MTCLSTSPKSAPSFSRILPKGRVIETFDAADRRRLPEHHKSHGPRVLRFPSAAFTPASRAKARCAYALQKSISCAIPRWIQTCGFKLYVAFARARLVALEKARSESQGGRSWLWPRHDGLQDFSTFTNELNDNIDTYVGRKSDLRKVLKTVIDGTPNSKPSFAPCGTTPMPGKKRWSTTNSCSRTLSKLWIIACRITANS